MGCGCGKKFTSRVPGAGSSVAVSSAPQAARSAQTAGATVVRGETPYKAQVPPHLKAQQTTRKVV